ncbi:MAG: hypothetical protein AB8H86_03480 [Polyangiales bacterium]
MRLLILLLTMACGSSTPAAPTEPTTTAPPEAPIAASEENTCQPDLGELQEWQHSTRARLTLRMGSAHHSTQGPVVIEGSPVVLTGKFAYGNVSKDLEGEKVQVFIREGECAWTRSVEGETDSDGRLRLELPAMPVGLYDYLLVVAGDHSMTRGVVAVLSPEAPVVVFDIDGTLTVSDGEVFQEALLGSTPEIFEGAGEVVRHYASAGVQPLYITGRTYHFQGPTIEWLDGQGLAHGPLHTTDSVRDAFPGSNVEEYKQAFLEHIRGLGLRIVAAYGNASSDVCAYARAGVPPEQTWIVGENGGTACEGSGATHALSSYTEHLGELRAPN